MEEPIEELRNGASVRTNKRVIRLSTERTNKNAPTSLTHQQDALMLVARSRLVCRRTVPIVRRYYSASNMEKRDYAVGYRVLDGRLKLTDSRPQLRR